MGMAEMFGRWLVDGWVILLDHFLLGQFLLGHFYWVNFPDHLPSRLKMGIGECATRQFARLPWKHMNYYLPMFIILFNLVTIITSFLTTTLGTGPVNEVDVTELKSFSLFALLPLTAVIARAIARFLFGRESNPDGAACDLFAPLCLTSLVAYPGANVQLASIMVLSVVNIITSLYYICTHIGPARITSQVNDIYDLEYSHESKLDRLHIYPEDVITKDRSSSLEFIQLDHGEPLTSVSYVLL
jgi:hypothetical protein